MKPTIFLSVLLAIAVAGLGCGGDETTGPPDEYSKIVTWAGTGIAGQGADGLAPAATDLYWPQDVAFHNGKGYILDWNNHRVREVADGVTQTIIGTGQLGDAPDGLAIETGLNHPTHVTFDPQGRLILSAWHNSKVMAMDLATGMIVTTCGTGARSFGGDGGPAEDAALNLPTASVFDSEGRLYIVDQANQRIRIVENGIINTFAGTGQKGFGGDGGLVSEAMFNLPIGQAAWPAGKIDIDPNNNIYIADTGNHRVRMIENDDALPAVGAGPDHLTNTIHTIAGNGTQGPAGDGIDALQANLKYPGDVAHGPDGAVYIADTYNHAVRRVDMETGIITTVAGKLGVQGYAGDGAHPSTSLLDRPAGVAFDADGNLYIADQGNQRIRVIRKNP